jgi:hypothetical protein
MSGIQSALHSFIASGLGQSVKGFLLPVLCILVIAAVAVAFTMRNRVTAKTIRRNEMRAMGITKSNYKVKLKAAQYEFQYAQAELKRATRYPLTMQPAQDRYRKAQVNLFKIRSFAA